MQTSLLRLLLVHLATIAAVFLCLTGCSLVDSIKQLSPLKRASTDLRLIIDRGHDLDINRVKFNSSGTLLASSSQDGTIKLWDVSLRRELRTIKIGANVLSLAFSHDGKLLAAGDDGKVPGKSVTIWDVATGKEIPCAFGAQHDGDIYDLQFSPDDKTLAVTTCTSEGAGSEGVAVRLWNVKTGESSATLPCNKGTCQTSISFNQDGTQLAVGDADGYVTVWDLTDKNVLHRLDCRDGKHSANAVFSQDGKMVVAGCGSLLKIFDADGQLLKTVEMTADDGVVNDLAISPDGKKVIVSHSSGLRMYTVPDGKQVYTLDKETKSVTFDPHGGCFATGRGDHISAYDAEDAHRWFALGLHGPEQQLHAFQFSDDGKSILTCEANTKIWDLTGKRTVREFAPQEAAMSPDGTLLATGGYAYEDDPSYDPSLDTHTVQLTDLRTGKILRRIRAAGEIDELAFSADGKNLLCGSDTKPNSRDEFVPAVFQCFDVQTGAEKARHECMDKVRLTPWCFRRDGAFAACSRKNGIDIIDARNGKTTVTLDVNAGALAFCPTGNSLIASVHNKLKVFDMISGNELREADSAPEDPTGGVVSIAFSPDGKQFATWRASEHSAAVCVWDFATMKIVKSPSGAEGWVAFSPDGKTLATGALDRQLRLWRTSDWSLICSLIPLTGPEWVVVDPTGRFDASKNGQTIIHFARGSEIISLDQLWDRFYEPQLLAKLTGFSTEPLRPSFPLSDITLAPVVTLDQPDAGSDVMRINLKRRDGGIGKVVVRVNGRELPALSQPRAIDFGAPEQSLNVDLSQAISASPNAANEVSVIVYNKDGTLASRDCRLAWKPSKTSAVYKRAPELYAIICGVSQYKDPKINLTFASKDAADFKKALEIGAPSLFGIEKVHVTLLASNINGAVAPTKANLEEAFKQAKRSKPEDVLVVYMAGHGVTVKEPSSTYYYLLSDADGTDLAKNTTRQAGAASSHELVEWITAIPATHQVMIFDTCGAGGVINKLVERRDFSSDGIRAIEQIHRRSGTHVLLGCAADAVSYESSQYSQGLLTYALLEGIRNTKGLVKDSTGFREDVLSLFNYARDRVPELAQSIGGIQEPRVVASSEGSFAIGLLKPEDTGRIPLARAKHRLAPPRLLEQDESDDTLDLSDQLGQRLNEISVSSRGSSNSSAPYVYITDPDLPDVLKVFGTYTVNGDKIEVNISVRRNHNKLDSFKVQGSKAALPALVEAVAKKVCGSVDKISPQT